MSAFQIDITFSAEAQRALTRWGYLGERAEKFREDLQDGLNRHPYTSSARVVFYRTLHPVTITKIDTLLADQGEQRLTMRLSFATEARVQLCARAERYFNGQSLPTYLANTFRGAIEKKARGKWKEPDKLIASIEEVLGPK